MGTCRFFLGAAALSLLLAGFAQADPISLVDNDKGYYSDAGEYNPTTWEGYFAGRDSGTDFRNFFVFDLSNVEDQIISAKLVINTCAIDGGGGTYDLFHVDTNVATLTTGGSGLGYIFTDLGEGTLYGSRDILSADEYYDVEIPLNEEFLDDVNAAGGLFAIGGAISTLTLDPQYVFGWYGEPDVSLVVETIPEPGTIVLLLTGVAAIFAFTRVRRMRRV